METETSKSLISAETSQAKKLPNVHPGEVLPNKAHQGVRVADS